MGAWNITAPAMLVPYSCDPSQMKLMPATPANVLQPVHPRCAITAPGASLGSASASLIALLADAALRLIDNLLFATIGANAYFAPLHSATSRTRAREEHQGLILLSWALRVSDTLKNILGSNLKSINIF